MIKSMLRKSLMTASWSAVCSEIIIHGKFFYCMKSNRTIRRDSIRMSVKNAYINLSI